MSNGALGLLHGAAIAGLGCMLGVAVTNLLTARRLSTAPRPGVEPRVSLLIPARDEEATLAENLPRALQTDYPDLEVLVLDDGSADRTAAVVQEIARHDPRVRVLRGTAPPPGWLGKSWACRQLADAASGEVLVFCDADVSVGPRAISRTVGLLQGTRSGLLTALPRQRTPRWIEAAVVPLVTQLTVFALLPLRLVEILSHPRLSMGNGQWMAFTRGAYDRCGGHAGVRDEVLEDVALARAVKRSGARLLVALAPEDLSVRMYRSASSLRSGFRKNLYALAGGRPVTLVAALALLGVSMIYPLLAPASAGASRLVPLGLLGTLRLTGAIAMGHSARSVVLHPMGASLVAVLAIDSALASHAGTAVWKGRAIPAASGRAPLPLNMEDG
jgi:glycosyltransferase involved in cell wall biosynthesis